MAPTSRTVKNQAITNHTLPYIDRPPETIILKIPELDLDNTNGKWCSSFNRANSRRYYR